MRPWVPDIDRPGDIFLRFNNRWYHTGMDSRSQRTNSSSCSLQRRWRFSDCRHCKHISILVLCFMSIFHWTRFRQLYQHSTHRRSASRIYHSTIFQRKKKFHWYFWHITIVVEYMAVKRRTLVFNIAFGIYFAIGSTILPWIAYYIANWRYFAYVSALPLISGIITPWILPESAR